MPSTPATEASDGNGKNEMREKEMIQQTQNMCYLDKLQSEEVFQVLLWYSRRRMDFFLASQQLCASVSWAVEHEYVYLLSAHFWHSFDRFALKNAGLKSYSLHACLCLLNVCVDLPLYDCRCLVLNQRTSHHLIFHNSVECYLTVYQKLGYSNGNCK